MPVLRPVRALMYLLCASLLLLLSACALGSTPQQPVATYPVTPSPTVYVPFTNIRVSRDQFTAHVQPSLAVNPRDPRNLLGAAEVIDASSYGHVAAFVSFDAGATWQENSPLPAPAGYPQSEEITVAFSAAGTGYVTAVVRQSLANAPVSRVVVWRTNDGGKTFSQPVTITQGTGIDFPNIAVDTSHSRFTGAVYVAWNTGNTLEFSRSTDGGNTFSTPQTISSPKNAAPFFPVVTVAPTGTIHIVYSAPLTGGASRSIPLAIINSADGGGSFDSPRAIAGAAANFYVGTERIFSLLASAVDPRNGTLYVAYSANRSYSENMDVMLTHSSNDGRTWSTPMRANNDPRTDLSDHFQPQLAVAPGGALYVSYLTLTNDSVDVYLAQSTDHGATFQLARRVNKVSWNQFSGVNGQWIGDYQGLAATSTTAYPFWNDGRTGRLEIFTALVNLGMP